MSWKLMEKILLEVKLSKDEKLLLIAMAQHAKDDGSDVFPSNARLAEMTGLSASGVRRIKKRLREELGIIVRTNGDCDGLAAPGVIEEYVIDIERLASFPLSLKKEDLPIRARSRRTPTAAPHDAAPGDTAEMPSASPDRVTRYRVNRGALPGDNESVREPVNSNQAPGTSEEVPGDSVSNEIVQGFLADIASHMDLDHALENERGVA